MIKKRLYVKIMQLLSMMFSLLRIWMFGNIELLKL